MISLRFGDAGCTDVVLSNAFDTEYPVLLRSLIEGKEDRLMLSMGYQVAFAEPGSASMNFEVGPEITSISIKGNSFSVGSRTYSILRAQTVPGNQVLNNIITELICTAFSFPMDYLHSPSWMLLHK